MRQPLSFDLDETAPERSAADFPRPSSSAGAPRNRSRPQAAWRQFASRAVTFAAKWIPTGYEDDRGFHYGSGNPFAEP